MLECIQTRKLRWATIHLPAKSFLEIEELLSRISPDLDVSFVDVEVDAHESPVDTTLPNWREKMRSGILGASEETEASDEESIVESEELKTPEVS